MAIATIGIMEKYTGQTFIIDTYEKNDNNSMRLDPLCNFCLHFQISGAGVNVITVARDFLSQLIRFTTLDYRKIEEEKTSHGVFFINV